MCCLAYADDSNGRRGKDKIYDHKFRKIFERKNNRVKQKG